MALNRLPKKYFLKFDKVVNTFSFKENAMKQRIYLNVRNTKFIILSCMMMILYLLVVLLDYSMRSSKFCPWPLRRETLECLLYLLLRLIKLDPSVDWVCLKMHVLIVFFNNLIYRTVHLERLLLLREISYWVYYWKFSVSLGRFRSNPRMGHWKAVKKVMRYQERTKDFYAYSL